jgi:hypothetical protein
MKKYQSVMPRLSSGWVWSRAGIPFPCSIPTHRVENTETLITLYPDLIVVTIYTRRVNLSYLSLEPALSTKGSVARTVLLTENLASIIPKPSPQALVQRFCLRREADHKTDGSKFFPKELTLHFQQRMKHLKPTGILKNSGGCGKGHGRKFMM